MNGHEVYPERSRGSRDKLRREAPKSRPVLSLSKGMRGKLERQRFILFHAVGDQFGQPNGVEQASRHPRCKRLAGAGQHRRIPP